MIHLPGDLDRRRDLRLNNNVNRLLRDRFLLTVSSSSSSSFPSSGIEGAKCCCRYSTTSCLCSSIAKSSGVLPFCMYYEQEHQTWVMTCMHTVMCAGCILFNPLTTSVAFYITFVNHMIVTFL